jgi:hypothetical protein
VWNTTAGGDGTIAASGSGVGDYYPGQMPLCACNGYVYDTYTNFGSCTSSSNAVTCGSNTGFYWTPNRGASLIIGLQICTGGSLPTRDPIIITFEGSNHPTSALHLGSSWTLIYRGPSGLLLIQVDSPVEWHNSFLATRFGIRAIAFLSLQNVAVTHPLGTPKFY